MKRLLTPLALVALAACSPRTAEKSAEPAAATAPAPAAAAATAAQPPNTADAGEYTLDPAHTSVNFRLSHMGLSHFTARFTRMDGKLAFDPANPAAQSVSVTIDARSLQTNYPEPEKLDFDAQVQKEFLEAARFPTITFKSTRIEPTGERTANVTGDLTLHGVTRPVTLQVTYNGGYKAGQMDPMGARVGFSAKGAFNRSDFGVEYGLPAPGTTLGVGDRIEVAIEAEFTKK
jgi:polyisoprenoid-binding protein YceI